MLVLNFFIIIMMIVMNAIKKVKIGSKFIIIIIKKPNLEIWVELFEIDSLAARW